MTRLLAELNGAEPVRLAAALQTGKKVPPDVTGLLADDHRTVLGWFGWYEQTADRGMRTRLIQRICMALKAHMAAEEEFFYPAIRRVEAGAPSAERALAEHAKAKSIVAELERNSDAGGATDALVRKLKSEIAAHVAEEELELFTRWEVKSPHGAPKRCWGCERALAHRPTLRNNRRFRWQHCRVRCA